MSAIRTSVTAAVSDGGTTELNEGQATIETRLPVRTAYFDYCFAPFTVSGERQVLIAARDVTEEVLVEWKFGQEREYLRGDESWGAMTRSEYG